MNRFEMAMEYCREIRYDYTTSAPIVSAAVARYGLTRDEARRLRNHVSTRTFAPQDNTLCGWASLRSARLPLNRIAEAFAA